MKKIFFSVIIGLCVAGVLLIGLTYRAIRLHCGRSCKEDYERIRMRNREVLYKRHTVRQVTLKTSDGFTLAGVLLERPHAKRVVLICHGRWQAKEFVYPLADLLSEDTLFFFDFRTHGASEGSLVSLGYHEAKDVKAAHAFLKGYQGTCSLPLYGIGFSMGAVALLKAAYEGSSFKGLVLDSAFAHLHTQLCRSFSRTTKLPNCMISLSQCIYEVLIGGRVTAVNPREFIKALSIPILIIHSENDAIVPVEDAYELYRFARPPKELWVMKGPRHACTYRYYPDAYKQMVNAFFQRTEPSKIDE
jgi:uncharacterized protein